MFYHAAAPADYDGDDRSIFDTGNEQQPCCTAYTAD
jgi:hypothetical protein